MSFLVKPLSAQLAEDHDLLGKSDPYCVVIIGNQRFQTKPHSGGGKTPKWGADSFKLESQAHEMKVQIFDDDIGKDELHGEGTLDLSNFLANPGKAFIVTVDIAEKKKKAGVVTIQVEYQGPAVTNIGSLNHPSKLGY